MYWCFWLSLLSFPICHSNLPSLFGGEGSALGTGKPIVGSLPQPRSHVSRPVLSSRRQGRESAPRLLFAPQEPTQPLPLPPARSVCPFLLAVVPQTPPQSLVSSFPSQIPPLHSISISSSSTFSPPFPSVFFFSFFSTTTSTITLSQPNPLPPSIPSKTYPSSPPQPPPPPPSSASAHARSASRRAARASC